MCHFYCCDSVVTHDSLPSPTQAVRLRPPLVVLPSSGTRLLYLRCFKPLLPLALVPWSIPLCAKPGLWIETNACANPQTNQEAARASPSHAPTGRVSSTLSKVNRDPLVTPW